MNRRTAWILLGLLAAPSFSDAQVTQQGNKYLFRMKFTKGQKVSYKMTSTSTGMGSQAISTSMTMTTTVTDVKNGKATMEVAMGQILMNGKPMGQGGQKQTITVDSTGGNVQGAGMGTVGANFPKEAIAIGDTWKASVPVAAGGAGSGNMQSTYKFVGFTNVNGIRAARITISVSGFSTGSGTMLVDTRDGSMISTDITTTTKIPNPNSQQPVQLKSQIKVVRV
jgi:NMD protein affecting ribosome stability and mRNA decay